MNAGRLFLSPKLVLRDRPPLSPESTWHHESLADTTTAYMLPTSENPIKIGSVNSVDGGSIGVFKKISPKFEILKFQERYLQMLGFPFIRCAFEIPIERHHFCLKDPCYRSSVHKTDRTDFNGVFTDR